MIVGVCIATAALFPFVGVFVYMLLRPPEYLADVHERELEIRAMERRLGADQACPYCRNPAEPSFLSCPYCGTKLKNACRRCKTPLDRELAALPALRDAGHHRLRRLRRRRPIRRRRSPGSRREPTRGTDGAYQWLTSSAHSR